MDSASLVDIARIDGLLRTGQKDAPEMWRKIGRPKEAVLARQDAERLSQPVAAWRVRQRSGNMTIRKSGSLLASLVLAGLGIQVTAEELAPIRQFQRQMRQPL